MGKESISIVICLNTSGAAVYLTFRSKTIDQLRNLFRNKAGRRGSYDDVMAVSAIHRVLACPLGSDANVNACLFFNKLQAPLPS